MTDKTKYKIRPYARLLTMLGEQLIKNERIALIELIKNSYDADASWVKISFNGFGDNFEVTDDSKIIIRDSGQGMNLETIKNHWLNPATPEKKLRKEINDSTKKGRVIQGEKGIGRFAILKLGREISIKTKTSKDVDEHTIKYDFSIYDDDFLKEKNLKNGEFESKELFIDDLNVSIVSKEPVFFKGKKIKLGNGLTDNPKWGTRIRISNLKGVWSEKKVKSVYSDITRLQPIFSHRRKSNDKFNVWIYKDNELQSFEEEYLERLNGLLEDSAVFRIDQGVYDENKQEFRFLLNGTPKVWSLNDPTIKALDVYRDQFVKEAPLDGRSTESGSFKFGFYVFDFSAKAEGIHLLDGKEKDLLRKHRIYLYRDSLRVYPYGEPDDDWLGIDIHRGTKSAGHFLANDQVVGYVDITQKGNPNLKDKTNREGLLDEGNATDDFVALLRVFLRHFRARDYSIYQLNLKDKTAHRIFNTEQVQSDFSQLKEAVKNDKKALALVAKAEKEYKAERRYLVQRAETTEDLAGVGLSVETASHDIMTIMSNAMSCIDGLYNEALHDELEKEELTKELESLRGMLAFIETQLKDVQLLFKSSKKKRRQIKVKDMLEKVHRIYRRVLKKYHIDFDFEEVGSPLMAKTTDAVILQLLLNLFDNSVYWLQQVDKEEKKIQVLLDGANNRLIFSDNGPGVDKEVASYIFEPFFSGKGTDGRGLGLYIARQLLERNDYSIDYAEVKSERILTGANFVANFEGE